MNKKQVVDEELARVSSYLNERGQEVPDSRPVEIPLRFRTPRSSQQMIQDLIRKELSDQAASAGFETWEEADDFDCGDEELYQLDPLTGRPTEYEKLFDGAGNPFEEPKEPPEGGSPEGGPGGPPPEKDAPAPTPEAPEAKPKP